MTERATYDAIVVGGRAAGAATAMLLARLGLRVLVVDRSRYGSDTLSTHALMRAGTLQLHRWDVLGEVVASGTPPVRRTVFHYDDGDVDVSLKPAGGVDALYAPRRTVLDAILADAARGAGAEVRFGTTVTDLVRADDGRVVGVSGHDRRGDGFIVRAPVTIGADGLHSVVARLVDAPLWRSAAGASTMVYGYWDGVDVDGYHWYFRQRAGVGVIPTNGGAVCVFAAVALDSVDAGTAPRSLFDRTIARVAPEVAARLAGAPSSAGYRMFAGRPGWMRRPFGPGWALVGDAGYFKDPISAHGITDALRDAELLARALGHADAERDRVAALRAYGAQRDGLSERLFATTDAIARYRWEPAEVRRLLLELNSAMACEVEALSALPALTEPALL
jgi:flavin-dependent dehydrogenase